VPKSADPASLLALLSTGGPAVRKLAAARLRPLADAPGAPPGLAAALRRAEPAPRHPPRRARAHPAIDAGEAALARLGAALDAEGEEAPARDPRGDWRWETDATGKVVYEEGRRLAKHVERLPMTEGAMADAMAWRVPFFGARCEIAGRVWELNGLPWFDGDAFAGYRGVGWPGEDRRGFRAPPPTAEALGQMAHEVRSPLNAILGFAQLIESAALGPVADSARADAARILDIGNGIVAALDDLLEAARVGRSEGRVSRAAFDLAALAADTLEAHADLAAERSLAVERSLRPAPLWADRGGIERLVGRLLAAVLAAGRPGERIAVETSSLSAERVVLRVTRPALIEGIDGEAWLDGAGDGHAAPLVTLGFALRLVREIAVASGGRFSLDARWITVELPAMGG
jgi:hypothetical protein